MAFGEILRLAREEKMLSVDSVYLQTMIPARYILMLEAEDWSNLPDDVHVKGYLRRYARLLELDGDSLWRQAMRDRGRPEAPEIPILQRASFGGSGDVRLIESDAKEEETKEKKASSELLSLISTSSSEAVYPEETSLLAREKMPDEFSEEDTAARISPPTSAQLEYRKKLASVRRKRAVITFLFWLIVLAAAIYFIWIRSREQDITAFMSMFIPFFSIHTMNLIRMIL